MRKPRRARWSAWLTCLLTAAAVTAVDPLPAVAAPRQPAAPAETAGTRTMTEAEALAKARTTHTVVPVDGATTPTDTLTANPDGTLTLASSVLPVRKHTANGWTRLDPTLHANADGTVTPGLTTGDVVFSGGGTGPLATLRSGTAALALTAPMSLPTPTLTGATATYTGVLPGVDLVVTADAQGGFSEVFVIRTPAAAASTQLQKLSLAVQPTGVTVSSDAAGNLTATDAHGRAVFTAPTPLMWDSTTSTAASITDPTGRAVEAATHRPVASSAAGPGARAKVRPMRVAVGAGRIDLTPDAGLLATAELTYPLYYDPTWSAANQSKSAWATITENYPSSNYYNKTPDPQGHMQVGNSGSGGIWSHTLINFSIPGTLAGATINSASLTVTEVYAYSCSARYVDLYAPSTTLTSSNATWNSWSSVNLGSAIASQNVAYGYNSSCPAASVGFDVKSTVAADVAAGRWNQTFALVGRNESSDLFAYKEFDAGTPQLSITYNHPPTTPTGMTTSPSTDCTASTPTTVGDAGINLYAPVRDPDGGTVGVKFELWKTSAPGLILRSSDPNTLTYPSGQTAVLVVDEGLLKGAAGTAVTQFSWHVQITDGFVTTSWSAACNFFFDPNRPGAPTVNVSSGSTIGQNATVTVTHGNGTTPTAYMYQLNEQPPVTVTATSGNATFTIKPTRFANRLAVTAQTSGGNFGDAASVPFNAAAPAAAPTDHDLDGDGRPDLLTVGGTGAVPAGLWQARGSNGININPAAANIGLNGTGINTSTSPNPADDNHATPASYTGAQVETGHFSNSMLQDVLVYYPTGSQAGNAVIISGNGDGSTLQPQYAANVLGQGTITDTNGGYPSQLVNAGNSAGAGLYYPDLLGTTADGTALNYFPNSDTPGGYAQTYALGTTTPTDGTDWNHWTLTTSQTSAGATNLFLWNPTTGGLYLWANLVTNLASNPGTLTFNQYTLAASGWNTGAALTLQAADVNADGIPDLRATTTAGAVTTYLVSNLSGGTGKATAQTSQTLITSSHAWPLDDGLGGTIATAEDIAGTLDATGSTGAIWHQGDLFSPDAALDGTGALTTGGAAVAPNADFTISAWVKPNDYKGTVLSQDGTHNSTLRLYADPATHYWTLAMSTGDGTTSTYDTEAHTSSQMQLGVWVHLTAVYQAGVGKMSLYVNAMGERSSAHTTTVAKAGAFRIGDYQSQDARADKFNGQIAEVQTWSQALTHSQVVTLSGLRDYVLFNPDNTVYPSGSAWATTGARMTFSAGQLSITETGSGTLTKTFGSTGHPNAVLIVQTDGNLVIYPDATRTIGTAIWATNTYNKGVDCYLFQPDGNFVAYDNVNQVPWSSDTYN